MDNEKPAIKLPRRKYYTIEELANYWRNELGIADAADSVVEHYVNEGLIKTSLRYEWPDGKGWFFEDYTARTHMINSCKQPPTEKCYMDCHRTVTWFAAHHLGYLRGDQQQDQAVKANGLWVQGCCLLSAEDSSALRTPQPEAVQLKDERLHFFDAPLYFDGMISTVLVTRRAFGVPIVFYFLRNSCQKLHEAINRLHFAFLLQKI